MFAEFWNWDLDDFALVPEFSLRSTILPSSCTILSTSLSSLYLVYTELWSAPVACFHRICSEPPSSSMQPTCLGEQGLLL